MPRAPRGRRPSPGDGRQIAWAHALISPRQSSITDSPASDGHHQRLRSSPVVLTHRVAGRAMVRWELLWRPSATLVGSRLSVGRPRNGRVDAGKTPAIGLVPGPDLGWRVFRLVAHVSGSWRRGPRTRSLSAVRCCYEIVTWEAMARAARCATACDFCNKLGPEFRKWDPLSESTSIHQATNKGATGR